MSGYQAVRAPVQAVLRPPPHVPLSCRVSESRSSPHSSSRLKDLYWGGIVSLTHGWIINRYQTKATLLDRSFKMYRLFCKLQRRKFTSYAYASFYLANPRSGIHYSLDVPCRAATPRPASWEAPKSPKPRKLLTKSVLRELVGLNICFSQKPKQFPSLQAQCPNIFPSSSTVN